MTTITQYTYAVILIFFFGQSLKKLQSNELDNHCSDLIHYKTMQASSEIIF